MDWFLLISDSTVLVLMGISLACGFALGWACQKESIHSIYVGDDGLGGIQDVSDRWDPDRPQPGDPLYPPSEWLTEKTKA